MMRSGESSRSGGWRLAIVLALAASVSVGTQQTRIARGDSSITGRVIDRQTKRPVANVVLTLTTPNKPTVVGKLSEGVLVTSTNAAGEYAFDAIAGGDYQLKAAHSEYPDTVFGSSEGRVIGGTIIRLAEKQRSTNHDFALVRAGSVSGMVTEAGGGPLNGASIRLIPLAPTNAFAAFNLATKTDERGRYTVARVPEGRFHVQASWIDQQTSGTPLLANPATVYFPGTRAVAEAVAVDVGPAGDVRNIDMTMIGDPLLRLSGHVIRGSSGGPIEGELRMRGGVVRTFKIAADGAFDLRLRSGRYVLLARSETDSGAEAGSLAVDLDSDTTGLLLTLAQGGRISGKVVTDDGSSIVDRLFVLAVLSDGTREIDLERRDRVEVSSSGAFELSGLAGDRVLRVVGLSDNWAVYQVLVGTTAVSSLSLDAGSVDDVTILLKRQ